MRKKTLKTIGVVVLAAAAVGALATLLIRDQVSRHRRDLFSPWAFKRLAALGHLSQEPASVAMIHLLRDFVSWEPRGLLRDRARAIIARMEDETLQGMPVAEPSPE